MDVLLHEALPQDLVKFGLIPELVGRLPVTVSLNMLDQEALVRILTEPKSAIVKQYQKLLELDGVRLVFDRDAPDCDRGDFSQTEDRSARTSCDHGGYHDGDDVLRTVG